MIAYQTWPSQTSGGRPRAGLQRPRPRGQPPSVSGLPKRRRLLELGVLGLGLDQHGNVGVGVFPRGQEVLVGGSSLRLVALKRVGASQTQAGERIERIDRVDAAVVEDLLVLSRRLDAVSR